MGYRVHYASKYEVEYDGGAFNWCSEDFSSLVRAEIEESWVSDNYEELEIDPQDVKAYIVKLRRLPDEVNEYLGDDSRSGRGYTNAQVADELQAMLDGYDKANDFIRLSWF